MSFDLKIEQGDLKIGGDGDFQKVENTEKLVQEVLKIAETERGGNPFFPWYGSEVGRATIGTPFQFSALNNIGADQLKASLETLQKLQRVQQKSGQKVTSAEILAAIQDVRIERNQVDPRYIRVFIKILSQALTSSTINVTL